MGGTDLFPLEQPGDGRVDLCTFGLDTCEHVWFGMAMHDVSSVLKVRIWSLRGAWDTESEGHQQEWIKVRSAL